MLIDKSSIMLKNLNETLVVEAIHCYLPKHVIQSQIEKCGVMEKKRKKLGSVLMVYFILYSCLFRESNRREVLKKLLEGYQVRAWQIPPSLLASRSGISKALKRIGSGVMRSAYEALTQNQKPSNESFYKGLRLKAYDGSCFNLEDSEENRNAYGKPSTGEGESAWPQLRLVMEIDSGTRIPGQMVFGSYEEDEIQMVARALKKDSRQGELALLDRKLGCFGLMKLIQDQQGEFLAHAKIQHRIKKSEFFRDGSYLGVIQHKRTKEKLLVRVIEYRITNSLRANPREIHRLVTSLLDETKHPACELIALFHQRWEIEISFDELKTHLFQRGRTKPFFRAQRPADVIQELYGLLILYMIVRSMMQEAAQKYDLAPRRLSFINCVHILRRGIMRMQAVRTELLPVIYQDLLDEMAATLLPERENRINPRVVKRHYKRFETKRKEHYGLKSFQTRFTEEIQIVSLP